MFSWVGLGLVWIIEVQCFSRGHVIAKRLVAAERVCNGIQISEEHLLSHMNLRQEVRALGRQTIQTWSSVRRRWPLEDKLERPEKAKRVEDLAITT